jgi:hypothetical protein
MCEQEEERGNKAFSPRGTCQDVIFFKGKITLFILWKQYVLPINTLNIAEKIQKENQKYYLKFHDSNITIINISGTAC